MNFTLLAENPNHSFGNELLIMVLLALVLALAVIAAVISIIYFVCRWIFRRIKNSLNRNAPSSPQASDQKDNP